MQAVVLVGGRGTRLGSLTATMAKPLLSLDGRPFIGWLLHNLDRYGFESILLLAGYRSEQFGDLAKNQRLGGKVDLVVESEPLGTGGALLAAGAAIEREFFLFNGDSLFDFNYLDMSSRTPGDCIGSLGLSTVPEASRYGGVLLDGDRVVSFGEKGRSGPGLINAGVYFLRKRVLDFVTPKCSLERDVLPSLPARSLAGFAYDGFFIDIGIPEDFKRAQQQVPAHFFRPAVIFDRDGTLNRDRGYTHRVADFEWLPGVRETIKLLNDRGYLVIVVTNQAGVARGYYTEDDVRKLHVWINRDLRPLGAHIDAFYFCPHHPTEGNVPYVQTCDCRKPAPGLIVAAAREWNIDVGRSFGVGDKESDGMAYEAAGIVSTFRSVSELCEALRMQSVAEPDRSSE
jgi:D-glycero-D-manno-heptose 1,7-bisphosphate phosphatase